MSKQATRLRILEAAFAEFAEHGFEATTMRKVAERAGCSLGLAYTYFPSKHGLGLALYRKVADEVEREIPNLPPGTIAERFAVIMRRSFGLLDAHRATLTALIAAGIDPNGPLATLPDATAAIRARYAAVFAAAVDGATDVPEDPEDRAALGRLVYGFHLLLVLMWTQDPAGRLARDVLVAAAQGLSGVVLMMNLPAVREHLERLDGAFADRFDAPPTVEVEERSRNMVRRLLRRRRGLVAAAPTDERAFGPHLPRVRAAVVSGRPLHLILPAFPLKSPSPQKTLGRLPDMAEVLALSALQRLCDELAEVHPPGVRLTICSGGAVFSDAVGVPDDHVVAYQEGLDALLADHPSIDRFGLNDAFGDAPPEEARARLLHGWAEDREALRERSAVERALRTSLDGLQRLLFEDRFGVDRRSREQVRARPGADALELLWRSRAWERLVAFQFPDAVRLSAYPQPAVSHALGVDLVSPDDAWLTPWHGVVLREEASFRLVKRHEAEALGARLVEVDGRPSHYER